jgi:hypothetical protein
MTHYQSLKNGNEARNSVTLVVMAEASSGCVHCGYGKNAAQYILAK